MIPSERLFDDDDVAIKPSLAPDEEEVEGCNLGTHQEPKMLKISKSLPLEAKNKYIHMMKEYSDVFAWTYKDLKVYDTDIIQHTIPIKEGQTPFK